MEPSVAIDALRREGAAVADLLTSETLNRKVASCPDWTVADLVRHLGGIHRWARHAVLYGPSEEPAGPDDDTALQSWLEQGLDELVRTLTDRDPDQPCWTFGEPPSTRFWIRRQAVETALHRWDVDASLGGSPTLAAELAVDAIDEVATMFLPRQVRLDRLAPGPESVRLVCDSGETFTLATHPLAADPVPDAVVFGTAEALLLLLWKRIPLSDCRLSVTGSLTAVQRLFAKALTP